MAKYTVQTTTSGANQLKQVWQALNLKDAEGIARRLSVGAMHDRNYPHPFDVVSADGLLHCKYQKGLRVELEIA